MNSCMYMGSWALGTGDQFITKDGSGLSRKSLITDCAVAIIMPSFEHWMELFSQRMHKNISEIKLLRHNSSFRAELAHSLTDLL